MILARTETNLKQILKNSPPKKSKDWLFLEKAYNSSMNTKFLEKYTIKPLKKTRPLFKDLAKKHMIKIGKSKTVHIATNVDEILYGKK